MKIAIQNGEIILAEVGPYYQVIKSWGKFKYNKGVQTMTAPIDLEALDKLSKVVRLPQHVEELRADLQGKQDAIDKERLNPDPVPLINYPVKANLFKHQIRGCNMAAIAFGLVGTQNNVTESVGYGFLFEMGCGKTLSSVATMGSLYESGKIETVLIVAPSSVCSVWPRELEQFADFKFDVALLQGEKKKRLEALGDLMAFPLSALKIAIINYESTHREGIYEALMGYNADMIICDESQRIKTHNASQSKAMHVLGDLAKYKLILSGTPVQNNAVDLYSQYRFLDPSIFGKNFYAFRNRYCVMGGFNKYQIVKYRDIDQLIHKAHSVAYRVTKEECLDLPEQTFLNRYIQFTPSEMRLYNDIKKQSFAELEQGGKITAPTVLTKMLRLQQLTGGFLQPDNTDRVEVANTAKLDALEEILEDYVLETGKKLVIFARFRAEIAAIEALLKKKKISYGCIFGDVKIEDRGEIVGDFQSNPDTKVFLAQLQTAGLGITLHAASVAVFYSIDFNYANYMQAVARIHRIGQRYPCTYINLMVEKTIDDIVLKAIQKKDDVAKSLVDNWRQYF